MHPSPSPTLERREELHSWELREPPREVGGSRPWQQIPANATRHRAELPALCSGSLVGVRVKYSSVDMLIPGDGPGAGVDCRAAQVYILGVMPAQWKRMVCGCLGLSSPGSILGFCQLCPESLSPHGREPGSKGLGTLPSNVFPFLSLSFP